LAVLTILGLARFSVFCVSESLNFLQRLNFLFRYYV